MVGTRGWEHDAWRETFYDALLPQEWRFCFFSNLIRSVLVPAGQWQAAAPEVLDQWMEDSDPEFRFVLELPAGGGDRAALAAQAARLAPRVAGYLLPLPAPAPADPAAWLADWQGMGPLCVDAGPRPAPALAAVCAAAGAGLAWHPGSQEAPAEPGALLVALVDRAELRDLRRIVERLGVWMGERRNAGLFFTAPEPAPRLAEEARIIAELLGV